MESPQTERKKVHKGFSLEEFARAYVAGALEMATSETTVGRFDEKLQGAVSEKLGIPVDLTKALHHPFHWVFFNEGESIFQYYEPDTPSMTTETFRILEQSKLWIPDLQFPRVTLRRQYIINDIEELTKRVLEKYGDLLKEKLKAYSQATQ